MPNSRVDSSDEDSGYDSESESGMDSASSTSSDEEELNEQDAITGLMHNLPYILKPGSSVDPRIQNVIALIFVALLIFSVVLAQFIPWYHSTVLITFQVLIFGLLRWLVPKLRQYEIIGEEKKDQ